MHVAEPEPDHVPEPQVVQEAALIAENSPGLQGVHVALPDVE